MRLFKRRRGDDDQAVPAWFIRVYAHIIGHINGRMDRLERTIMTSLQELQDKANATLASVTAETDLDNAIAKIIDDKNAQIADLKAQLDAAGTDPVKLQALSDTMDQILQLQTSNSQIVSSAVQANTAPPTT